MKIKIGDQEIELQLYAFKANAKFEWFHSSTFSNKDQMTPESIANLANAVANMMMDTGKHNWEELKGGKDE